MQAVSVYAALPITDMATSIGWYDRLVGREPDNRPMPSLAEYHLADGVGGHGTIQLVADPERAGGGLVTIVVDDAHEVAARLASEGIELTVDDTSSEIVLFGTVSDPDGNAVTIIERRR